MDSDGIEDLYQALNGRAPAIAVAIGDSTMKPVGTTGFQFVEEYEIFLYLASNHARDLLLGRAAADATAIADVTADPGLDIIKAHAKELVIGQRCGVTPHDAIKQLRPDRQEMLTSHDGLTLWLQSYKLTTALTINPNRGLTQMLTSIAIRTTQADDETELPTAATSPTTIDAITDTD
jgi:hypothetical protein